MRFNGLPAYHDYEGVALDVDRASSGSVATLAPTTRSILRNHGTADLRADGCTMRSTS
jgi:hypothetical protein